MAKNSLMICEFDEKLLNEHRLTRESTASTLGGELCRILEASGLSTKPEEGFRMIVRLYADDIGRVDELKELGPIQHNDQWSRFVESFNTNSVFSRHFMTYIDMQDKNTAQDKISNELFSHYKNPTCETVVLGVCCGPCVKSWLERNVDKLSKDIRLILVESNYMHWENFISKADLCNIRHLGEPFCQARYWQLDYMTSEQIKREIEKEEISIREAVRGLRLGVIERQNAVIRSECQ